MFYSLILKNNDQFLNDSDSCMSNAQSFISRSTHFENSLSFQTCTAAVILRMNWSNLQIAQMVGECSNDMPVKLSLPVLSWLHQPSQLMVTSRFPRSFMQRLLNILLEAGSEYKQQLRSRLRLPVGAAFACCSQKQNFSVAVIL